ncbi:unnamed protein product [Orchesella dallaii]|uniref:Carboxylic ester hydrolase n=1 Tax=Orchesella dallaii TaxID=48710 RepID=A0ABP1QX39_9HEXA
MKLGDVRSVISRIFHILNVSMSLLNGGPRTPTDPTVLLPEGFGSKPSIRQGRARVRGDNETQFSEKRLLPPIVQTDMGEIEGYYMRVVSGRYIYAFEGIPYALSPEKELRFKAPVPKSPWNRTLHAKSAGPRCTQSKRGPGSGRLGSEDCLYLNIYTPEIPTGTSKPKLVPMIFIHGGAFYVGTASDYGPSYLMQQDVVLVTINYRLGVLGFFTDGTTACPGNWGLKDQAEAIDFVYKHIHNFGGDPSKIVLFGQSAGATSTHFHTMSNRTNTKIAGAISMSGTAFNTWTLRPASEMVSLAVRIATLVRCRPELGSQHMVDCLRSVSVSNLFAAQSLATVMERKIFLPVIEPDMPGAFISKSPRSLYKLGLVAKIPYIFSMTSRELELGLAFKFAGFDSVPRSAIPLAVWPLAPQLLDYQGKVSNDFLTTMKIIRHYGGEGYLSKNPEALGQIATDRHFSHGIRKAIEYHSKIAPTYAEYFAYRHYLGYANDLKLNPFEFGTVHGEDVPLIFNRTERKPVGRNDQDFAIVQLIQNLYTNFATFSEPLYTSEDFKDLRIWEKVDPNATTIKFLQIDKDVKMITVPAFENATNFWNSLNINDL